ncbi:universal stress protein [Planomicrobium sp. YIM 101495]|uniref:universal stress protein n=1 Tax=Planomicrobium sp. YIM 101495 TaxID=2665160 RepID=UPI0012B7E16A|nr:universal stress protein [Planomicrobium sp. YIM 101495]MTD31982.1 universal stress protein [Planomicrobium sp. YIM 101495]
MYQHIILAADGSENAVRAAEEAVKIATYTEGSKIEVVMVADFNKATADRLHTQSEDSLLLERQRKIANVEHVLEGAGVPYTVTVLKGDPGPEIVRYVNDSRADLVVIGSRGLNSLQEMMLGSVSHKVMKRVKCPALIVK